MNNVTVKQLILFLLQLPAYAVKLEQALKNVLVPILAAIGATKNHDLNQQANKLMVDLFNVEVQINRAAQSIANVAQIANGIPFLNAAIGGYQIPIGGASIVKLEELINHADQFQSTVIAHNPRTIESAKDYAGQLINTYESALSFYPGIANMSAGGVSLAQLIDGVKNLLTAV